MKKYNSRDHLRALTWAKKIMAVNFLGGKCIKCGNNNIFALEFHHCRGKKEECISRILNKTNTKIMKEVRKCELLCRNCHAEMHCAEDRKAKIVVLGLIGYCNCKKCNYRGGSFSSLDFHHLDEKKKFFGIATTCTHKNITDSYKKKIIKEIKKCIVLCKNCHMELHIDKKYFKYIKPLINYKVKHHIEHKSPEPKRLSQIEIRGSEYRNRLAVWLRVWKRFGCVSAAAKYLGVKNNMLGNNLMKSKVYRRIRAKLSKKTSRYIGVSWAKLKNKWLACVKIKGKTKNLGCYDKEIDAFRAVSKFKKQKNI